jgi:hypothetical protein
MDSWHMDGLANSQLLMLNILYYLGLVEVSVYIGPLKRYTISSCVCVKIYAKIGTYSFKTAILNILIFY